MCVQSLTLEGYFHIHLLKVESFSVLTFNLSLKRLWASMQFTLV